MTANQDSFSLKDGYCSQCVLLVTWALLIICCLFILTKNSLDISKHCIFLNFFIYSDHQTFHPYYKISCLDFFSEGQTVRKYISSQMILYIVKFNKPLAEVNKFAICKRYEAGLSVLYVILLHFVFM